jgi:hypothetical protein
VLARAGSHRPRGWVVFNGAPHVGRPCDTPTMIEPLCAECSRPILPTDNKSTVQQVDACTMAVEHVTYHSTCWDQKTARKA